MSRVRRVSPCGYVSTKVGSGPAHQNTKNTSFEKAMHDYTIVNTQN